MAQAPAAKGKHRKKARAPREAAPSPAIPPAATIGKARTAYKLTPPVIEAICEAYASGLTEASACSMHGVSFVSWWRHRQKNPELDAPGGLRHQAHALNTLHLEQRALHLALTADHRSPTMLIFMLKSRMPSVYRDNLNVQHDVGGEFAAAFARAMMGVTNVGTETTASAGPSSEVH